MKRANRAFARQRDFDTIDVATRQTMRRPGSTNVKRSGISVRWKKGSADALP